MIEYESLALSNAAYMDELEAAASRVIRSGWYVLGQEVSAFEAEFAQYTGARHCVGVANGLDALILSLEALDLPRGSEVMVASNTYIATILAIVRAGLVPVLVEPVRETFNMDPALLAQALTPATRAICVTHLFGKTCRMDAIGAFAQAHGLKLVEDCAQSHGARLGLRQTGTFGDAGCFSFYPTKNLGALGDAGAVVTNDDALAERLRHLRNYGSRQKYVNKYVGVNLTPSLRTSVRWRKFTSTACLPDWPCRRAATTSSTCSTFSPSAIRAAMPCASTCWSRASRPKSTTPSHHTGRRPWRASCTVTTRLQTNCMPPS